MTYIDAVRKFSNRVKGALKNRTLGSVVRVATDKNAIALTFDDGPNADFTSRLLDILATFGAKGTFFMVGRSAAHQPDLVQKVAAAGHAVGNHSWDHPSFPLLSRRERVQQIRACESALVPHGQRLFRPPHGHQNLASYIDARRLGYDVITWSATARDWFDLESEIIVENLLKDIQPGRIILFHDALYFAVERRFADREKTLEAVAKLLETLSNSYRCVTVPELMALGRPIRRIWNKTGDSGWLKSLKLVGP